jgi:hypothetical protein
MDARNPPRYERGIIITDVSITVLSMRNWYHREPHPTSGLLSVQYRLFSAA